MPSELINFRVGSPQLEDARGDGVLEAILGCLQKLFVHQVSHPAAMELAEIHIGPS